MRTSPLTTMVFGLGVAGRAVVEALVRRGCAVVAVDDRPNSEALECVQSLNVDLIVAPTEIEWPVLLAGVDEVALAPGIPDDHPFHLAADSAGVPVIDESDLANRWDNRPRCAVTGTNGKTTVVTLVAEMLERSGLRAVAAGNTDTPLVAAIDDVEAEIFVVEASSFRLGHAASFRASPAAWLNFAPDHLDVHADLKAYEDCKARIFENVDKPDDAVVNAADPVVLARSPLGATLFGTTDSSYRAEAGYLIVEDSPLVARGELPRALPHDLDNALAATAVALRAGAEREACKATLLGFGGLSHRMALVGEVAGVQFVDDSKATTPHATLTALAGIPESVLIAGGRNKGLNLSDLSRAQPRAVVVIGEAADELADAFSNHCPVLRADSMEAAVFKAHAIANGFGTVLLSPACSSFDWYDSYEERGRDYQRAVEELQEK